MSEPTAETPAPSTVELTEIRERAIDANERYRNALMWLARITTCVVFAALGVLIFIAIQNNANGNRLVDCTTPGHDCYDEANARSSELVQGLIDSIHDDNQKQTQILLRELEQITGSG